MVKKAVGAFAHLGKRDRQQPDLEKARKPQEAEETGRQIQTVHWSELYSEAQVRTVFHRIDELAETIKQHGQEEPVKVHPKDDKGYLIRRGERRWRACRKLDTTVDIVVVDPQDETKELVLQLIENIQKEDLNPIDEARAYQQLKEEHNMTQREIASLCGVQEYRVSKALRLLRMDIRLQELMLHEVVNDKDTLNLLDSLSQSDSELFQILCDQAEAKGSLTRNDVRKAIADKEQVSKTPKPKLPVPKGYKTRQPGKVSLIGTGADDSGKSVEGKVRLDVVTEPGFVMIQIGEDERPEFKAVALNTLRLKDLIG